MHTEIVSAPLRLDCTGTGVRVTGGLTIGYLSTDMGAKERREINR